MNFLKYKKPEKSLSNLKKSEVLKLIKNLDAKPLTKISERSSKALAAIDIFESIINNDV